MRVCKKNAAVFAVLFTFFAAFSQNEGGGNGTLQMPTMPTMPTMQGISSSMQMPSVSAPVAPTAPTAPSVSSSPSASNNQFYVPGFQNQNAGNGGNGQNSNANVATTATSEQKTEDSNQNTAVKTTQTSSSLAKRNMLTADDISALYDSGLFGNLTSLNGITNLNSGSTTDNTTLAVLQKILASLEELKESQKGMSVQESKDLQNHQLDSQTFKNREPKILRFKINGYNINDSITKVFFSETESDGSFLLTGDRKYYAGGVARTETFYALFKAVRSNGSAVTYDVQPSVVQDSQNVNSFIYRLSGMKNLRAEKTGNLVALHSSSGDLNVDLLLDIDGER